MERTGVKDVHAPHHQLHKHLLYAITPEGDVRRFDRADHAVAKKLQYLHKDVMLQVLLGFYLFVAMFYRLHRLLKFTQYVDDMTPKIIIQTANGTFFYG